MFVFNYLSLRNEIETRKQAQIKQEEQKHGRFR
jgi:hypothetical protein